MRLICPSCDAQYEVADNVIPEKGRDVQCSNCGTTWFQSAAKTQQTPAPRAVAKPRAEANWRKEEPEMPVGSTVSDDAASILREEALRELKARLGERPVLESQPEMGLAPAPAPRPAPHRPPSTEQAVAGVVAASRSRLPDIEEIDGQLQDTTAAREEALRQERRADRSPAMRRIGFRMGFVLSLAAGIAAIAAYVFAPDIAQRYPEAGPALAEYVAQADRMRIVLDGWVETSIEAMTDMMSAS